MGKNISLTQISMNMLLQKIVNYFLEFEIPSID